MKYQFQSFALVVAVGIVMVAASRPVHADLGDQLFKLLPDDGAAVDNFGRSVAISPDGIGAIVGAYLDDDDGTDSGSAYLFDTTTGQQIAKLLADDSATADLFGWSVAISGATAIAGAPQDDDNGDRSGSAYLFDTTTGRQLFKLLPDDGAAGDEFGYSVAISGATAIVGAYLDDDNGDLSGSAYLFDTTTGRQIAKLLPDDGAAQDIFGTSVAISGGTAIVGATHDDDNGDGSGSAYLFDTTTGRQLFKLLPNDGATNDLFGVSVAISGTTAIVGAYWDDDNGSQSGSAYLFDTTTGRQIAKLLPDDGAAQDFFGRSVAISGATAIVGVFGDDDNGPASGSAYLFDTTTGRQIAKLLANDGAAGDAFGMSVAISGAPGKEVAIVGSCCDDDNGINSGSAYLFDAGGSTGTPARLTSFRVLDGTLISGGLPRLRQSDDRYLEIEARVTGEVAQPHLMRMRIIAESDVQDPTEMVLTFESHITDVEGTVWLFLRNWRQGELVQVAEFAVGMDDEVQQVAIPRARRFIRTSDGRIKLQIKKIVFFPFTLGGFHSLIDQVEILVR